jgi:hypothetical protein
MSRLSIVGLWLGIVVAGCAPAGDDDDTMAGDDDSAAVLDDDDSAAAPAAFTVTPGDGATLSWDTCIELLFDETPEHVSVLVSADGSLVHPFVGQASRRVSLLPRDPWPVGTTLTVQLSWDGGSGTLTYPVEAPIPVASLPVGTAVGVDLSFGHVCPDTSAITLVLPTSYHALVEVTANDGAGSVDLLMGFSQGNTTEQDPCIETITGPGDFLDPLLRLDGPDTLYPWSNFLDATRRSWMAVQLDPAGGPPPAASFGLMFDAAALDDLVGDDACALMETLAAPWCGPCPDEPGAECVYLYYHSAPAEPLATPVEPRTAADIEADPACDP